MSKTLSEQFDEEFKGSHIECGIREFILQSHITKCDENIKRLEKIIRVYEPKTGSERQDRGEELIMLGWNQAINFEIGYHTQHKQTLLEELNTLV